MIDITNNYSPNSFSDRFESFWNLSAQKIDLIRKNFDTSLGAPVFTVEGRYTTRGWTEWTQGFQFGSAVLQFDATDDKDYLDYALEQTLDHMAPHVTHVGVHDHGFNNVSTYGGVLRLMNEGRIPEEKWLRAFLTMALKCSGAVQGDRWTDTKDGLGYIYSFNGPHSLFSDTARTVRSLMIGHQLGHFLASENDLKVSLLDRGIKHLLATAEYNVYYGEGRDGYDERGRVVHESVFNTNDGNYRCPSSQQGYSPFTTWTRGQAWVITGFAEEVEFLQGISEDAFENYGGKSKVISRLLESCLACCDHFIDNSPEDGVPLWDTGGPSDNEPLDSSAAAIAAQGMLRISRHVSDNAERYSNAGFKIMDTLLSEPFLSTDAKHEGLLLNSVYHWPNRWDHVPSDSTVASGEATMWGDYHLRELVLYVQRLAEDKPYLQFF